MGAAAMMPCICCVIGIRRLFAFRFGLFLRLLRHLAIIAFAIQPTRVRDRRNQQ